MEPPDWLAYMPAEVEIWSLLEEPDFAAGVDPTGQCFQQVDAQALAQQIVAYTSHLVSCGCDVSLGALQRNCWYYSFSSAKVRLRRPVKPKEVASNLMLILWKVVAQC
jgi:hypothetical protein